jgi:hypothetical protein
MRAIRRRDYELKMGAIKSVETLFTSKPGKIQTVLVKGDKHTLVVTRGFVE